MSKNNVPQYVYEPADNADHYAQPTPAAVNSYTYYHGGAGAPAPPPPPPPPQGGVAYAYGAGAPPPPPPSYRYVYSERAADGTTRHFYYVDGQSGSRTASRRDQDDMYRHQQHDQCLQACCEGIAVGACAAAVFTCCLALCGFY